MLNAHLCTSLVIGFVMSLTHPLVEIIPIFFHYMSSTVSFKSMPHIIICSFAHICVSNKIEGVRIPCCAHCIQMQKSNLCTYLGQLPHFICITNLCSSYYLEHSLKSYHNIYLSFGIFLFVNWFIGSFDCLLHSLMLFYLVIFLQSFDPQYSLIPSTYSSMDKCI